MTKQMYINVFLVAVLIGSGLSLAANRCEACTRCVYLGSQDTVVVARSMDWMEDPGQVMTNSPTFDEQLALNKYWEQIGGLAMLPGTNRAADRFARASFFINAIPQTDDAKKTVAAVFSIIRGVSVPLGITVQQL